MKERKISRRAVCSAMVASLALGVLEGCGSSSSTTASSAAGSGAAASNERITVRILKSKAANEVAAEQMDVWKVLGEKFNMDFEFDNPPQDNYNERLNLVMMDAQLPDIIMDMPTTEVLKYGESGVILSLNDYIDNSMPNLKKEIDKRDGVEKALTYSDGNIYYMPMLDEKVSGNMPYIVRTDWLEKLGIESPVTLEDWENYWHLVKTTDLNGNGTNDEIPFSSYNMDGLRNFCTAFGCLDDFYTDPDDGGKVHYGPIDPKYKKAVTWMHDMYEKGYIDPEIITMDIASFMPKLAQNTVASFYGPLGGMLAAQNATMPASFPGFHVEATVPPKGDAQIHSYIDQEPRAIAAAAITAGCKNVDRVIALLDYMYSDEGTRLINMGIEGTHYTMQNGKPIFTDYVMKNPDGLSPKNAIGTFTFAQSSGPFILSQDEVTQLDDDSVNRAKQDCIIPFLEESKKYVIPGSTSFSSEDDAVRRAVMADVDTYVDEMIIKFVSGREPLSNWDTYVEKVNGMGIAEVIDIYQKTLNG